MTPTDLNASKLNTTSVLYMLINHSSKFESGLKMSVWAQNYDIKFGSPFSLLFSRHPCFGNQKTEIIYPKIWHKISNSVSKPLLEFTAVYS